MPKKKKKIKFENKTKSRRNVSLPQGKVNCSIYWNRISSWIIYIWHSTELFFGFEQKKIKKENLKLLLIDWFEVNRKKFDGKF